MNAEDQDYLALIKSRNDPDADKRWLITRLEAEAAEVKRQSMARIAVEEAFMRGEIPLGIPCKQIDEAITRVESAEADRAALRAEVKAEVERLRETEPRVRGKPRRRRRRRHDRMG